MEQERERQIILNIAKVAALLLGIGINLSMKQWKAVRKMEELRRPYVVGLRLITYLLVGIGGIAAAKITNKAIVHGLPGFKPLRRKTHTHRKRATMP